MADLRELYQQTILEHNRSPRNFKKLGHADRTAEGDNPLCGDHITLYVRLDGDVIREIGFQGSGCAISQASASLLTERLKGMPLDDAKKINKDDVLGELGIDISPARIKCALLSLKVLKVGAYGLAGDDEE